MNTVDELHRLIDGDMLVYSLGYASEHRTTFVGGDSFNAPDFKLAKRLINERLDGYCGCSPHTIVLSGSGNYRLNLFPEYKANRTVLVKPTAYDEIRKWITSLSTTVVVNGEEADDYISVAQTKAPGLYLTVSADKDFFTCPGHFYNISSGRLFRTSIQQSFSFLLFQALAGDRVDGYYGVPWLGVQKARKLLMAQEGKTLRQAYLEIKKQVLLRTKKLKLKTREERVAGWKQFQLCLDLAALRWYDEEGTRGIGLRRVRKHQHLKFEYYLPYYDVEHNVKYGKEISL